MSDVIQFDAKLQQQLAAWGRATRAAETTPAVVGKAVDQILALAREEQLPIATPDRFALDELAQHHPEFMAERLVVTQDDLEDEEATPDELLLSYAVLDVVTLAMFRAHRQMLDQGWALSLAAYNAENPGMEMLPVFALEG